MPKCKYEPFLISENKFEVGDEVIWSGDKVTIWGKRYDKEMQEYEYAVIDKDNGRTLLFESELSPLKKKDKLEVGDKFVDNYGNEVNILAVHKENKNGIMYFGTYDNNKYCDIWPVDEIKKIIYD